MIYCPNCGTANKDGSGFCNQCGHKLGSGSKTICPSCGAPNPIENVFCDSCGAKLTPLVTKGAEEKPGVKGLSLPTKPLDEEVPEETPEGDSEDVPDWLRRLRYVTGADQEPLATEKPAPELDAPMPPQDLGGEGEAEIPDWLRQLRAAAPPTEEAQVEPPAQEQPEGEPSKEEPAEAEVPEWMRQIGAEVQQAVAAAEAAEVKSDSEPVTEETPSISPLAETPAEPEEKAIAEEAPLQEPLPQEVLPVAVAAVVLPEEPPPGETPAPAEAREAILPPAVPEEVGPPEEQEEAPPVPPASEEALAAWLQEEGPVILEAGEEAAEGETIVFAPEEYPAVALPQAEIPAWLESLAPGGGMRPDALGPAFAGKLTPEEAGLERAQIPAWLELLRPGRAKEGGIPVEETAEESGILEGVRGALRLVEAIDPSPETQARAVSESAAVTPERAELLTRLLGESTSSLVKPKPIPTQAVRERGLPWLTALLLVAAVVLPFFLPGLVPGGNTVPASTPAEALASSVQSLQPGDTVLVSFDYDPGVSTELDWPARIVLDDLKQKGVNILLMGTTPTGPGLAARFDWTGAQMVNLGYLPGQEMGLQQLTAGITGAALAGFGGAVPDAPFGVRSLSDVKLILTVASSQETIRWWVEQVGTQVQTPIAAIVSAAIEPAVRPYYASDQLAGLVSGWVGGQAYQRGSGSSSTENKDVIALEAQSLAHLVIAGLIVLGNIAYWGKRLIGRQS